MAEQKSLRNKPAMAVSFHRVEVRHGEQEGTVWGWLYKKVSAFHQ